MPDVGHGHLPLEAWHDLYVLLSTAAATLVGLLFVVITLAAEQQTAREAKKIRLYLTPTVVYLAAVLLLSAMLTFPTHSRLSASLCCCGVGAAGILYALSGVRASRHGEGFFERRDVWQYSLRPAVAFILLVGGGALVSASDPQAGLTLVAVSMLGLIALALRNSWSIAVSIVSSRTEGRKSRG